jgi:hypothetical protein
MGRGGLVGRELVTDKSLARHSDEATLNHRAANLRLGKKAVRRMNRLQRAVSGIWRRSDRKVGEGKW